MKHVIEFGVRGGAHTSITLPSGKLAASMASSIVGVLLNDHGAPDAKLSEWKLAHNCPRRSWTSSTHFVSVSKLDGVMRGPASPSLWSTFVPWSLNRSPLGPRG